MRKGASLVLFLSAFLTIPSVKAEMDIDITGLYPHFDFLIVFILTWIIVGIITRRKEEKENKGNGVVWTTLFFSAILIMVFFSFTVFSTFALGQASYLTSVMWRNMLNISLTLFIILSIFTFVHNRVHSNKLSIFKNSYFTSLCILVILSIICLIFSTVLLIFAKNGMACEEIPQSIVGPYIFSYYSKYSTYYSNSISINVLRK